MAIARTTAACTAAFLVWLSSTPAQSPPPVDPVLYSGLKWRCIGPFRGGRSVAVTGVTQQPFTFYFGSCGGGIWKTTDAGTTWKNVSDGQLGTGSVGALAVAPSDPNVIYAGMGEADIRGVTTSFGDGVYRSTDAGTTWVHLGLPTTRHIATIVVHPADPDTVWVAAQGNAWKSTEERGVYRSRDGGASWERVLFVDASSGATGLSIDPGNPRALYAAIWDHQRVPWQVRSGGPGSGIYRTVDGGDSWEKLSKGLPELMGKTDVAVSPARPDRVWVLAEADEGGLFRSDDGGVTFKRVNAERVLRARAWYYIHLFADPANADTVYVMNAPFMKSIDGGATFKRISTPHGDNHALWINPDNPALMINGNDGGANVSLNGGATWSTQSNQPTAQFYRVITDAQFPYRVYGGQQDNSTVGIQSRSDGNGIGREHWSPVGGGESAFVAFDPDDPRHIYAGVYQGLISAFDRETGFSRDIMAYPFLGLGADPKDLRYRFNWNAPIVASPHDPKTIYHAGNVVLRTRDGGLNWEEISGDLTRNEIEKHGRGGVPITNEAAGGETYNTIQYLVESPHEPGVLWVGTDDGLVHLSRDGGSSWSAVAPRDFGEAMINAIECSPHDPATAYVAVTRYKYGDFTPHVWVTRDYGETWKRIADGLPEDAFVRVVREDPERKGLLYAGTELGAFVSFDDGGHWQPLQLNLPLVPITDLTIRNNDLVAATQGRAFWILDDLSPLQQHNAELTGAQLHLFTPRPALRVGGGGWQKPPRDRGQNPPPGATIDYVIGEEIDVTATPLVLEIYDSERQLVRRLESSGDNAEPSGTADRSRPTGLALPAEPGMNRAVWDLRAEAVTEIPGQSGYGSRNGYRVSPGTYEVRLSAGDHSVSQPLTVLPDPRLGRDAADFGTAIALARELHQIADDIHRSVVKVRSVRRQIRDQLDRVRESAPELSKNGKALVARLETWEEQVVQSKQETQQDVVNFANQLNAEVLDLLAKIDRAGPPLTAGMRERATDLEKEWREREQELRTILGADLSAFNELFRSSGLPVVHPGK